MLPLFTRRLTQAAIAFLTCLVSPLYSADLAPPQPDSEQPATSTPTKGASKKPLRVRIEMRDGLRFDPPRFETQPGQEVVISLENADTTHQPHNFLILQPGKREEIVQLAMGLGEKGAASGFIPESPEILVHSELVNPEGTNQVRFVAPQKKGIYPYVCTMPGHGMVMYGAMYVGIKAPPLGKDTNIPIQSIQSAIPGSGRRPFVQRMFLPKTGPASIAVALPGELNFCWDAGQCRLRYLWRGPFIDAAANWRGNGRDLATLPTLPWWSSTADGFPLQIGSRAAPPSVKFLGYKLSGGIPEFHYRVGAHEVFETISALPQDAGVTDHFRISAVGGEDVRFNSTGEGAVITGDAGSSRLGSAIVPANRQDFAITFTAPPATPSAPAPSHP